MNIQNQSNINFQANKVLTASRVLKNGCMEVVDVFKLDFNKDREFAKLCVDTLSTRELKHKQNSLKRFFQDFLNEVCYYKQDYFVAIKDGEQITNAMYVNNENMPCNYFTSLVNHITHQVGDKITKDSLLMSLLESAKKEGKTTIKGADLMPAFKLPPIINKEQFGAIKRGIKKDNPEVKFEIFNNKKQTDLKEFLGLNEVYM